MWSKIKAHLRDVKPRSVDALLTVIPVISLEAYSWLVCCVRILLIISGIATNMGIQIAFVREKIISISGNKIAVIDIKKLKV